MAEFRLIPSIESVLQRPALAEAIDRHGRESVARAARQAADELRHEMTQDATVLPDTERAAAAWIEQRTTDALRRRTTGSLRPVINATGVILHTNLGRAPLARAAADRAARLASGYSNLEYDLDAGARGHRDAHTARLFSELTGAESAAVVNNNAAATLLVLTALAAGREVVVSRGELVEIGGGFRIPDVMRQSGASLREVGTTNRTRLGDYSAAVNDRTALILRVHPSNFRIEGFTERPSLEDLVSLGRRFNVPVFEDLGSGWLGAPAAGDALADEPVVSASVHAGADLVAFSGDKLLGGPQAGIIVGRADLVERVRRHPLMRALRADKFTYAALEATLALWSDAPARSQIPVYRMLSARIDEIERRARQLAERLSNAAGVRADIIDGESTTGGGSAPQSSLPTKLVALRPSGLSAAALDRRLRMGDPPVLTRIVDDAVVVDLRTVADEETAVLADAIASALQQ